MTYRKIRFDFKYCKSDESDRFFRTLLVKKDLNLLNFGIAIVQAFKGQLTHSFTFEKGNESYIPPYFEYASEGEHFMQNYTVEDLGKKFTFCYDLGDGWYFNAKVYSKEVEDSYEDEDGEEQDVVLIDGAGQGIWEDTCGTAPRHDLGAVHLSCRWPVADAGATGRNGG